MYIYEPKISVDPNLSEKPLTILRPSQRYHRLSPIVRKRAVSRLGESVYLGPEFNRAKAVKANRQFRVTVGWKNHLKRIEDFLNISRGSDEGALANAVAEWQHKQKSPKTVDGIINATTWARMRAAGVLKGSWWWNLRCSTTPVTNGEFGTALKWFANSSCVPDGVVKLLKGSPKFMAIAKTLDGKYIADVGRDLELTEPPPTDWEKVWGVTPNGFLIKGTYRGSNVKGRRVLRIMESLTGSSFSPAGSPETLFPYDTIFLQQPSEATDAANIGRWIEVIAHESIHAHHWVSRTGAPPAKLVDRVRASIAEEIATRREETAIVSQILATSLGKKLLKGFKPKPGATDAPTVERDFFPTALRRTYLEHFVLLGLSQEAISRERLTPEDIDRKNKEVERMPISNFRDAKFSSDYSKAQFSLRVIDFRWQKASKLKTPGTPDFDRLKEQILQEHANAFFGGVVSYTALP